MILVKKLFFILILFSFLFSKIPDAVGYNGMVVTSNKYASEVGVQVLKKQDIYRFCLDFPEGVKERAAQPTC